MKHRTKLLALACSIFSVGIFLCVSQNTRSYVSKRHHVAICITGQVGRLELESKVKNLFVMNDNAGIIMSAFLVLDPQKVQYSKAPPTLTWSSSSTPTDTILHEASHNLRKWLRSVSLLNDTTDFSYIADNSWRKHYLSRLEDPRERQSMLSKHLKQFWGNAVCANLISYDEVERNVKYDVILRIRDNSVVVQPFQLPIRMLLETPGAYVKNCAGWGGVNDKVMLTTRKYMNVVLRGWIDSFMFTSSGNSSTISNPERFLQHVLVSANVPIVRLEADIFPIVDGRIHYGQGLCIVEETKDCHPSHLSDYQTCLY